MATERSNLNVYSVEDYNPEWSDYFETIKKMLYGVFGNKALAIEHIGSTSIPGMKAKPLIDVLIVVEKMELFESEKMTMKQRGYEIKENYIAMNSLLFTKSVDDRKIENIHICVKGSLKIEQFIDTRDYLRAHPQRAVAYSEIKEKLKQEFPHSYPGYRAGKKNFLDETERLAQEWKGKA